MWGIPPAFRRPRKLRTLSAHFPHMRHVGGGPRPNSGGPTHSAHFPNIIRTCNMWVISPILRRTNTTRTHPAPFPHMRHRGARAHVSDALHIPHKVRAFSAHLPHIFHPRAPKIFRKSRTFPPHSAQFPKIPTGPRQSHGDPRNFCTPQIYSDYFPRIPRAYSEQ